MLSSQKLTLTIKPVSQEGFPKDRQDGGLPGCSWCGRKSLREHRGLLGCGPQSLLKGNLRALWSLRYTTKATPTSGPEDAFWAQESDTPEASDRWSLTQPSASEQEAAGCSELPVPKGKGVLAGYQQHPQEWGQVWCLPQLPACSRWSRLPQQLSDHQLLAYVCHTLVSSLGT